MIKKGGVNGLAFSQKHFVSSTIPTCVLAHFKIWTLLMLFSDYRRPLRVHSLRKHPRQSWHFISGASIYFTTADFVLNCTHTALFTTCGMTKHVFAKQLLSKSVKLTKLLAEHVNRCNLQQGKKFWWWDVHCIMLSLYQHLVCFVNNVIHLCIFYRVSCSVVLVLVK